MMTTHLIIDINGWSCLEIMICGLNITINVRVDGSAEKVMLKLNGGVDLNWHLGLGLTNGELRDNPPALSHDHILGFEDTPLIHRSAEKICITRGQQKYFGLYRLRNL